MDEILLFRATVWLLAALNTIVDQCWVVTRYL